MQYAICDSKGRTTTITEWAEATRFCNRAAPPTSVHRFVRHFFVAANRRHACHGDHWYVQSIVSNAEKQSITLGIRIRSCPRNFESPRCFSSRSFQRQQAQLTSAEIVANQLILQRPARATSSPRTFVRQQLQLTSAKIVANQPVSKGLVCATNRSCNIIEHVCIDERRKLPGCRQETLIPGTARSATRVHFIVRPFSPQ